MLQRLDLSHDVLLAIIVGSVGVLLLLIARLLAYRRKSKASVALFRKQEKEMSQLLWEREKEMKELHQRMQRLEDSSHREVLLFSEITSILGYIQDSEESLKAAFGRMLEILSIDFGILELTARRTLSIQAFEGCEAPLLESLETIAERGWVLEENASPFDVVSFEEYQKSRHFRVMESAHSLLCFPCRVKATRTGYFLVGFHEPHEYTQPELDGLNFCADQFAVTYQLHTELLDTQELSRLRHDYIANVSHELRTPLTTIYGYLGMLKGYPAQLFPEGERQEMFSVMTDECQRLMRLINNLLLSVKVEQADFSGTMNTVSVSLAQVVAQTCRFMDGEFRSKNVELRVGIPEDLPPIEGNLDLLYQVFQNLFANSIKFSGKDPKIEVWARTEGDQVAVRVSDNGVGIEEQAIPRIFQKFYRAESQAGHRPGLGIGLYLVQKLVQLHHGEIQVASELNKGTTFTLSFPALNSSRSISQRAVG